MITSLAIKSLLEEKANQLIEAKFKRVVRQGVVVRKQIVKLGFKIVRSKGGRTKIKRMSPIEKRNRHISVLRAWKKNHSSRVVRSHRMLKKSLIRRKAVFGS